MKASNNISRRGFIDRVAVAAACAGLPRFCLSADLSTPGKRAVQTLQAIPLQDVTITGSFWKTRAKINEAVTIPHCFKQMEETGLIGNFDRAAGKLPANTYQPNSNNKSGRECDLFKTIEGAAYVLQTNPDAKLDRYVDGLIAKIAAAQEPDGYLYTTRRFLPPSKKDRGGTERWANEVQSQETYVLGHLYEAAVAHFQATGKRSLLNVAVKSANLLCEVFGPKQLTLPPGHPEVEMGLIRLHAVTGDERYLKQAAYFLDIRGRADTHKLYGVNYVDHQPLVEQKEAVGHAVRATYLYSAMADMAMVGGRQDYLAPLDRFWSDVVGRKLFLIGGAGLQKNAESYGKAYELSGDQAYCETCAAISHAMWAQRMFLIHGDAAYIDVMERIVYNNFLAGTSLSGDKFFYDNTLTADGREARYSRRSPWFPTPCCPTNTARFVPLLASYAYARKDAAIFVNLFGGSEVSTTINGAKVRLIQEGEYPWEGNIKITVEVDRPMNFAMHLRIPGWARNEAIPGELYRFAAAESANAKLAVNGQPLSQPNMEKGFAVIQREWKTGDTIQLDLPMSVRRVLSHEKVTANRGKVALQRGPLVYCVEDADNTGNALNLSLPNSAPLKVEHVGILGGVTVVKAPAEVAGKARELTAIPYYAWGNRAPNEKMTVWLPIAD